MRGFALGVVELAVAHAGAGRQTLHLTRQDGRGVANAVLVRQRAVEHIADDLHVAVAMGAKAGARGNVLVDHPQVAKAHVCGVVVIGKREGMEALQPAVVGKTTVGTASEGDHVA